VTSYRVARRQFRRAERGGRSPIWGTVQSSRIPAVYTSQSIALALLEILVHIDKSEVPSDYVVMAIGFSGRRISRRSGPDLIGANQFDVAIFKASFYHSPVLRVPSVIVPREYNFVLRPEAAGFTARVEWVASLSFDSRLFSLRGL
jgi:RES domain-containing protein